MCRDTKADMLEAINELQTAVNTSQFTPTQEMRDTIDFIETMKRVVACLNVYLIRSYQNLQGRK